MANPHATFESSGIILKAVDSGGIGFALGPRDREHKSYFTWFHSCECHLTKQMVLERRCTQILTTSEMFTVEF